MAGGISTTGQCFHCLQLHMHVILLDGLRDSSLRTYAAAYILSCLHSCRTGSTCLTCWTSFWQALLILCELPT